MMFILILRGNLILSCFQYNLIAISLISSVEVEKVEICTFLLTSWNNFGIWEFLRVTATLKLLRAMLLDWGLTGDSFWQRVFSFTRIQLVEAFSTVFALSEIFAFWRNEQLSCDLVPFVFILGFTTFNLYFTWLCLGGIFINLPTNVSYFAYCWLTVFWPRNQSNACLCTKKPYWFSRFLHFSKYLKVFYELIDCLMLYYTQTV